MPDNSFNDKVKFIEDATKRLDRTFTSLSEELYKTIIEKFVDQLEKKGDTILNNSTNLQLIASIEYVYAKFADINLPAVAAQITTGANKVNGYNVDYYSQFEADKGKFTATTQKTQKIIRDRLGITAEGNGKKVNLKPGGYMDSLLKDNSIKNELKNLSYREVMKGAGFQDFKKGLETFIVGDKETLGGFKQFYRNYAYDIFVDIDRHESTLIATELDLKYFIYEGPIIDTSRKFCIDRAGKVFSIKEAEKWIEDPWIKKNLDKGYITTYDPVTDMGLFSCRHIPRFISKEVAYSLRPELKKVNKP